MSTIWKPIPLFISSTFRDMHAERDHLNNVVFPALAERLRARRCRFEPIDLRLGIESNSTHTERERELQILKVCLAEIERSRPFLLVLLGDRYGWVPGEDSLLAAASEAGFAPEDHYASVTALEIEYGLLKKDPVPRRRCLLCLRESLPYHRMPADKSVIFSDAYATDPGAPDRFRRLQKLKSKIFTDPELVEHRFPYRLEWDETRQQPKADGANGLYAWGQKVEHELWRLLEEETKKFAVPAELTWQEEECFAIEEFVERLGSSFVGRKALVQQALDLVLSQPVADSPWGICFTGESGSGKSALFARLYHQLSNIGSQPPFLLTHAAGVSPRAGQVEFMLRRWIGELGKELGEMPAMPDDLKSEDLEKLFAQMFTRVATNRRVVVLVDALNQFVSIERARTMSWLPAPWPENARFLATSTPGEESAVLEHRQGLAQIAVPPLEVTEAEAVAQYVYARYHRTPNADVLRVLLALRRPDGELAAGNPLWLTLALDLLNQLDGDDFTAVEAVATDSADARLRRLVLERARVLPSQVEELYGEFLRRVEKVVGIAESRAFTSLIALSRHGWREEDLQHLLPKTTRLLAASQTFNPASSTLNPQLFAWDPLRFAILRRCFRAHMVKRGVLEQWDFAHATLRQVVRARLDNEWKGESTVDLKRALYVCGANYLQTSTGDHALGKTELLWQILGTRDSLRAATYYASGFDVQNFMKIYRAINGNLGRITLRGDNRVTSENLATYLLEDWSTEERPLLAFVTGWLTDASLPDAVREGIAHMFTYELQEIVGAKGYLALRKALVDTSVTALNQRFVPSLEFTKVDESECARNLVSGLVESAEVLRQKGDHVAALHKYQEALLVCTQHGELSVMSPLWQIEFAGLCHHGIGHVLRLQADLPQALNSFQTAIRLCEILSKTDLKGLLSSKSVTAGQCHQGLGDVLMAQGDLSRAVQEFRSALQADKTLQASHPNEITIQSNMAISHCKLGSALRAQGNLDEAQRELVEGKRIYLSLISTNPSNVILLQNLSSLHVHIAHLLAAMGELEEAFRECENGIRICEKLVAKEPMNLEWLENLAIGYEQVGDLLSANGDVVSAMHAYQKRLKIAERLAASSPANPRLQRGVAISHQRLGNSLFAQGKLTDALHEYEAGLRVANQLLSVDADNPDWQLLAALNHEGIGEVLLAGGDVTGAVKAVEAKRLLDERLVVVDPTNVEWQRCLSVSYYKLGMLALQRGLMLDAQKYLVKCFIVLEGLRRRNMPFDPQMAAAYNQLASMIRPRD